MCGFGLCARLLKQGNRSSLRLGSDAHKSVTSACRFSYLQNESSSNYSSAAQHTCNTADNKPKHTELPLRHDRVNGHPSSTDQPICAHADRTIPETTAGKMDFSVHGWRMLTRTALWRSVSWCFIPADTEAVRCVVQVERQFACKRPREGASAAGRTQNVADVLAVWVESLVSSRHPCNEPWAYHIVAALNSSVSGLYVGRSDREVSRRRDANFSLPCNIWHHAAMITAVLSNARCR